MSRPVFRFREFPVYQDALDFRSELKRLSLAKFPKEAKFTLRPQLWRALDSIILNIAEGAERQSDRDFSRFLNISLGSVNEVAACLDCAFRDGYISAAELEISLNKAEQIARQLKAFLAKVRKDNRRF